jgi:hypothetical protein
LDGWISHTSCILQPLFSHPLSFTKCNTVHKCSVFSMYVFGCTLMSRPAGHYGITELFNIEK